MHTWVGDLQHLGTNERIDVERAVQQQLDERLTWQHTLCARAHARTHTLDGYASRVLTTFSDSEVFATDEMCDTSRPTTTTCAHAHMCTRQVRFARARTTAFRIVYDSPSRNGSNRLMLTRQTCKPATAP